jgi:NAD(P)-dependent dehydrogenase (short-subunit alcohol dehydrogenase family)
MNLSHDQRLLKPICLITGATEGVGKATAAQLAFKGVKVVLSARNEDKARAVKSEIEAATGGEVDIISADLASLRSVRQLAEIFKERYPRLDVLINNAGIFGGRDRRLRTGPVVPISDEPTSGISSPLQGSHPDRRAQRASQSAAVGPTDYLSGSSSLCLRPSSS